MRVLCAGEGRRKPPFSFVVMLAIGLGSVPSAWGAAGFFARLDSFSYSEPVSIDAALNDWEGRFYGGDKQWSYNWVAAGYRYDAWSVSVLYRRDFWLAFNADTAELYHSVANKLPLTAGRHYKIDISAYSFAGLGVRGTWSASPLPNMSVTGGLSIFNADHLLLGDIDGNATALADNDYEYNVSVDYIYSEDKLFDRAVDAPDGIGTSLDVSMVYSPTEHVTLRMAVVDLFGLIRWKGAPFTQATAVSDRQGFDDEGYIIVEPAISGIEGYYGRYTQKLKPRVHIELEPAITEKVVASLQYRYQFEQSLFGFGARARWGESTLGVVLWPELEALGLELGWRRINVGFTLDAMNREDIRTLWLNISVN